MTIPPEVRRFELGRRLAGVLPSRGGAQGEDFLADSAKNDTAVREQFCRPTRSLEIGNLPRQRIMYCTRRSIPAWSSAGNSTDWSNWNYEEGYENEWQWEEDWEEELDPYDIFSEAAEEFLEEEIESYLEPYNPEDSEDFVEILEEHLVEVCVLCTTVATAWDELCEYDEFRGEVCRLLEYEYTVDFETGCFQIEAGFTPDFDWVSSEYPELVGGSCYLNINY